MSAEPSRAGSGMGILQPCLWNTDFPFPHSPGWQGAFSSACFSLWETFPTVFQPLWPAWGEFGFDCLSVCAAFEVKWKYEDGPEQGNGFRGSAFL